MERKNELTKTFEMSGKSYRCTVEAFNILSKVADGKLSDETGTMVFAVGLTTGAIVEMK
jgi:hypothetical protein